ncbi:threonine synthase, partial [Mycobacterium tuberculosis]|nr:threonine synthase [Mycobacterium tuberculosis]
PASCASIAGLIKNAKKGVYQKGSKAVAVLTGNGLKDPNTAIDVSSLKPAVLPNDERAVMEQLKGVGAW